jgi:hypothetical protein
MGLEISAQERIDGLTSWLVLSVGSGRFYPLVPLDMGIRPINVFPLLLEIHS